MVGLTLDEIVAVHRRAMAAVGLQAEQLDQDDVPRLIDALNRASAAAVEDDFLRAAALAAVGVARAQAFHDGNKRTALAAAAVYLEMAGYSTPTDWTAFARLLEPAATSARPVEEVVGELMGWLGQPPPG